MAEIHVQPKERTIWPWVLGFIAVLLLLWVVVDPRGDEQTVAGDVEPGLANPPAAPVIPVAWVDTDRFLAYARDSQPDFGDANRAHDYTRNGLTYLAGSLEEITRQDRSTEPNIQPSIAAMRQGAEALNESAAGPEHAAAVKRVLDQAVTAMNELQRARFPSASDAVNGLRDAANAVSGSQPLLEQEDEVREFFQRAAAAVQAMGAPAPGSTSTTGATTTTGGTP